MTAPEYSKGDVIRFYGRHFAIYLGNNEIVHYDSKKEPLTGENILDRFVKLIKRNRLIVIKESIDIYLKR